MKLVFLSDQHLSMPNEEKCQALLRFFKSIRSPDDCAHLFLLGDIFDLWISAHEFFVKKWFDFNSQLVRLQSLGVQVHYFEGNHDLYLKDYFAKQLGVKIYDGPAYLELANKTFRIEHGDQMDPNDRGYRFLRWFLRTKMMTTFAKGMPDAMAVSLGEWASRKSRKYTSVVKVIDNDRAKQIARTHALKTFAEKPFDVLVCGHTHTAMDEYLEIGANRIHLINLGFQQEPQVLTV